MNHRSWAGVAGSTATDAPHIQLRTTNRSENVAVVRELLDGLAAALVLDDELTDDVKTAVSEACNNVVLHAYEGGEGPMELDVTVRAPELELVIRDRGTGIRPHADRPEGGVHGVGLAVIQAYADRVQFRGRRGEGTEVRMVFGLPDGTRYHAFSANGSGARVSPGNGEVVVSVRGGELLAAVLARVTTAMAVRAHFTVDRLSDAQLVADAIAAQVPPAAPGDLVVFALDSASRELMLRVGPLKTGGGRAVAESAPGGLAPMGLCDEIRVEAAGAQAPDAGEQLCVRITDPR